MQKIKCYKCGETKNISEFKIGKNQCKICYNLWMKEYKKTRIEKTKIEQKRYREDNKELLIEKSKIKYNENKLKFRPEV
jgi:hypothetical protein